MGHISCTHSWTPVLTQLRIPVLCAFIVGVQAIAKLPLYTWDEAKQQQQEQCAMQCSICTEVLRVGDQVQQLPCHSSHLFHPACLAPWLSKSNACPVCREVRRVLVSRWTPNDVEPGTQQQSQGVCMLGHRQQHRLWLFLLALQLEPAVLHDVCLRVILLA